MFAVAFRQSWRVTLGCFRYPGAGTPLVAADSGGFSAARSRASARHLAAFAGRRHLEVTVFGCPSGSSQGGTAGHRLLSFICVTWRGKPLTSYQAIANSPARPPAEPG